MAEEYEYLPGVCNIGPQEVRLRRIQAIAGLLVSAVSVAAILLLTENRLWRLAAFVPFSYLAINVLQVYYRFCVAYGMAGVFNLQQPGKHNKIMDPELVKKDRQKVFTMAAITLAAAGSMTALFYYL